MMACSPLQKAQKDLASTNCKLGRGEACEEFPWRRGNNYPFHVTIYWVLVSGGVLGVFGKSGLGFAICSSGGQTLVFWSRGTCCIVLEMTAQVLFTSLHSKDPEACRVNYLRSCHTALIRTLPGH